MLQKTIERDVSVLCVAICRARQKKRDAVGVTPDTAHPRGVSLWPAEGVLAISLSPSERVARASPWRCLSSLPVVAGPAPAASKPRHGSCRCCRPPLRAQHLWECVVHVRVERGVSGKQKKKKAIVEAVSTCWGFIDSMIVCKYVCLSGQDESKPRKRNIICGRPVASFPESVRL